MTSTALAIPDQVRSELAVEARDTSAALARLEAMVLDGPGALALAVDLLRLAKDRRTELEEKRTSITRPMNEAKRAVDALFAPVTKPLERAEAILRSKIAAYQIAQTERTEAAMLEVAAGSSTALVVPDAMPDGVTVRELWDYEVTDEAAVPARFLSVDDSKVRKHMAFADTERTPPVAVPGLRFFRRGRTIIR